MKEAWDALKGQRYRESFLQKVRLRLQHSCKLCIGYDIPEHINQLKSLHDRLKEMGVNIDNLRRI